MRIPLALVFIAVELIPARGKQNKGMRYSRRVNSRVAQGKNKKLITSGVEEEQASWTAEATGSGLV